MRGGQVSVTVNEMKTREPVFSFPPKIKSFEHHKA